MTENLSNSSADVTSTSLSSSPAFHRMIPISTYPLETIYRLLNMTTTNRSLLAGLDLSDLGLPDDDEAFYYHGEHLDNLLKPWTKERLFIPTISIYGVTFLLGLIGNSLVLFAMIGDSRKSRCTTASFMISLAVADLLFLFVCVPYETAKNFIGHWDTGTALCKISGAVEMLSALSSVLNLMTVSIERYMVIVHPMKARSWCTFENTKKIVACVWFVALALSSPTLYVWATEETVYYNNVTSVTIVLCADIGVDHTDRLVYATYQFLIMFLIPVIIIFVCYTFVIHALWMSSKQLIQMTSCDSYLTLSTHDESVLSSAQTENSSPRAAYTQRHCHIRSRRSVLKRVTREHSAEVLRARKQVIKMLITIVLVFLVCWGPKLLFSIFQRIGFNWIYNHWAYTLKIIINLLPFIHSCLNPIIYGFMSRSFRSRMKNACRAYICRRPPRGDQSDKRQTVGSDHELDLRSTNGTVQTKLSLRHKSSSHSDT